MTSVTIVDYGMSNLGSIRNMFRRIGVDAPIATDAAGVMAAQKLLLPGVGAFGAAMSRINGSGLRAALDEAVLYRGTPVLGICLGMQLLTRSSEEGDTEGLGWIAADTRRFPASRGLKVPHMGWNVALPTRESALTAGLGDEPRFYFVHSYYVTTEDPADSILRTEYGVAFDSAVAHGHILGAQFHPEKSHRFGMRILQNFARM